MPIIVNLDVMMAKRKMTLSELAAKVDLTLANLSILKNNHAKAVRFSTLEALCKALDCQPGDILEFVPEGERAVKKLILLVLALGLVNLLNACSGPVGGLSRELNADLSAGEVVRHVDTHGGFHGDGASFVELSFSGKAAERLRQDIPALDGWEPFPLTDNLQRAVYGSDGRGSVMCEDEIPNMPPVEVGYYCFVDRNSESTDPKDDTDLFARYSHNFTIAVYDPARDTIYAYRFDT